MGEVEYKRAVYAIEENGVKKYVYLLDEDLKIETVGKVSINLAERALEKKAGDEKREQDRWIHYGNCRYLEGQIDTIHQMINGAFGFKV